MEKVVPTFSRRRFMAGALAGLGATLLAACTPQTVEVEKEVTRVVEKEVEKIVEVQVTSTPAPPGQRQIVYYDRTTSAPQWGDAYNETHDDIHVAVEIQPPNQRYEQLIAAIMAGNAPDVIGLDCVQVGRFAQLGAVTPLEELIPAETLGLYFQNLVTKSGHYGVYQGHLYGVPFWVTCRSSTTTKFYEEAGGDPENAFRSWDDYIVYGKAATGGPLRVRHADGRWRRLFVPTWIWAQGGDFVNSDWTASTTASDPAVANMLQFMRDLIHAQDHQRRRGPPLDRRQQPVHQPEGDEPPPGWRRRGPHPPRVPGRGRCWASPSSPAPRRADLLLHRRQRGERHRSVTDRRRRWILSSGPRPATRGRASPARWGTFAARPRGWTCRCSPSLPKSIARSNRASTRAILRPTTRALTRCAAPLWTRWLPRSSVSAPSPTSCSRWTPHQPFSSARGPGQRLTGRPACDGRGLPGALPPIRVEPLTRARRRGRIDGYGEQRATPREAGGAPPGGRVRARLGISRQR